MNVRYSRLPSIAFAFAAGLALVGYTFAVPGRAADTRSEIRSVSGFDRVSLEGAFKTAIIAGKSRTQVTVRADGDTIGRVTTKVEGHTLVVGMKSGNYSTWNAPEIEISLPLLRGVNNEGAGSIDIRGLTGGDVELEGSGAASIVASGRARRETLTLNGAGRIDTRGVDARDVSVENNGVGSITVRASGELTMNVNGVGDIRYTGEPTHVESHINGIGHIGRL